MSAEPRGVVGDGSPTETECVCAEINTRHCPVHGQGDGVASSSGTGHDAAVNRLREWAESDQPIYSGFSADIPCALHEIERLRAVEDAARQLVRRDISIEVVALCEANLIAALAEVEAFRAR